MRRRRLVVFAAATVTAVTLLIWALQPYLTPPVYHTMDITLEYRNLLHFIVTTDRGNVRALIPSSIPFPEEPPSCSVYFELGLLHMEIEGKSYDAPSLHVYSALVTHEALKVPRIFAAAYHHYLFSFFTNNSEMGEVLRSHGLPHTYVQATYRTIIEGPVNRTRLTMTYPNGSLLVDISYTTSGKVEPWEPSRVYVNDYYLRNDNLTVLHWKRGACLKIYRPLPQGGIGQLNMTIGEGSLIWRILGRIEYAMNIDLWATYPLYRKSGKIAWIKLE